MARRPYSGSNKCTSQAATKSTEPAHQQFNNKLARLSGRIVSVVNRHAPKGLWCGTGDASTHDPS